MRLDTSSLELLARIARLGAIGEAGRDLGLSPTVATQRVQALEADLGVKLLNRTTRSVSLTPDGEAFLVYARRILSNVEDAQAELSSGRGVVKGQIRVTASASFGRRHIAPYLADFLAQYPDMRVRLELNDGIVDIVDQGIDIAFRIGTLASSSLVARKLADNPRFLVAAPGYLE
ncbi:MAG: LysR substrate-binding domain-containing protein, partial [Pseudomonadota bacterium]